jgi:alpha-N-arabinofuranosidase
LLCILHFTTYGKDIQDTETAHPILNASFEKGKGDKPDSWGDRWSWGHKRVKLAWDTNAFSGKRSVKISSDTPVDAQWHQVIKVKPYSTYRLGGRINTAGVQPGSGGGVLLCADNFYSITASDPLTGTHGWTNVTVKFKTGHSDAVEVLCVLGLHGRSSGTAWFDAITLTLLDTKDPVPAITIDASETGSPISVYLYGQFIEHVGRCIFGGIWAEMLEDRKFLYPLSSNESPWQITGPVQSVTMNTNDSYVGQYTPEITGKKSGIAQAALALRKGKEYTGRIILSGNASVGPVRVRLVWGDGKNEYETVTIDTLHREYLKYPLRFTAGGNTDNGRLEISGNGTFRIGAVSLMPADNIHGLRKDTMDALKQLNAPCYRWPGGNFVSGYNWMDGIGDPDKRPPRKNPAWDGMEDNDFGIDEFMFYCKELNTEPFIIVNSGLGGITSALEEMEYIMGTTNTPMGQLRAANGHAKPYDVQFWGVGNEMFGGWQLGYMPVEQYAKKHNLFAVAMKKKYPSIIIFAVGEVHGGWSEYILKQCADNMDFITQHFYRGYLPGLAAHVRRLPTAVKNLCREYRAWFNTMPELKGKDIKVAFDEWNHQYGPYIYGQLGNRYYLRDALGISACLHEMFRNSDIVTFANYSSTVNAVGCIKASKTDAQLETTGLALQLYREQFGSLPVKSGGTPDPLDVCAALTPDKKAVTIGIVNPTYNEYMVPMNVKGIDLGKKGTVWRIAGNDEALYNAPDQAPQVIIDKTTVTCTGNMLTIPPVSVNLYRFPVQITDQ